MSTAAAPAPIRSTIPARLYVGYVIGGAIMVLGGIVELLIGIKAEGKSLEAVTKPLTSTADRPPPELLRRL